ncbi:hypothetical protein [Hymenobacter cheonanensis]|uniref:hypothetical protein n=1 Tax=Hymenobacter sp. CA2-7 TaxID=3063993 RepID=UPI002713A7A1|nr:hypothetical protein [Hymenobacter sp. CA2-7]MDO7884336.1 hypothetical protein [Hymenobacter sp. CA2-7]
MLLNNYPATRLINWLPVLGCWLLSLWALNTQARPAGNGEPRLLATALRGDGTLRPDARGTFTTAACQLQLLAGGRPSFRPAARPLGAGDQAWQDGNVQGYANNGVWAVAIAANGDVYVAGNFAQIGGVSVSNIARWNGSTWTSLGTGLNDVVFALALAPNGVVYAGGYFTQAGGQPANQVAKWDGTAWSSLGAGTENGVAGTLSTSKVPRGGVFALAVAPTGEVYVGGGFATAGSQAAGGIARWNGTAWSNLGTGISKFTTGTYPLVYGLAVTPAGRLYMAGSFNYVNNVRIVSLAQWNGTSWSGVGNSDFYIYEHLSSVAVASNGDLYVGGDITTTGPTPAVGVARWDGTKWNALGAGVGTYVYAIAVSPTGEVYASGDVNRAGGNAINNVARWNGTSWVSLGTGLNAAAYGLALATTGRLYAGGFFTATGDNSKPLAKLATYDRTLLATRASGQAAPLLQLYPNPAQHAVTVELAPTGGTGAAQLRVRDALGRVVVERPLSLPAAGLRVELPLGSLSAGVYQVEVAWGQMLTTRPLTVE